MRVEFTILEGDFFAASGAHYLRRCTPRWKWLRRGFQPILAVTVICLFYLLYFRLKYHALATALFYLSVITLILSPYFKRQLRRPARGQNGPVILTITDESIHAEAPGITSAIEWTAILGVLDRPKVILLYASSTRPLVIPRRILTDSMYDELLSLCRSKGIPFTYPKAAK